jgi:cytochrome c peroxidase
LHGNGQSCETCHQPQLGWSITPEFLRDRFEATRGTADAFRVNDSADNPRVCGTPKTDDSAAKVAAAVNACVFRMSIAEKREAYELFNKLGVARIAIKINGQTAGVPNDDFVVTAAPSREFGVLPIPAGRDSQQPCSVQGPICVPTASLFRRPLITTNTFFDSSVLWEGRQNVCVALTPAPGTCTATTPLQTPLLETQVSGAARTLLLAAPPTKLTEDRAAHFMTGIFTARDRDRRAGSLQALGATGGPQFLADMASGKAVPPCTPLVEAPVDNSGGGNPPPDCSTTRGFTVFNAWNTLGGGTDPCAKVRDDDDQRSNDPGAQQRARLLIACGQQIFNTRQLNDPPAGGRDANNVPNGRCTSCHSAQNVGDNPSPTFRPTYTPNGGISQQPSAFVGGATDASTDPFCATNPKDPFCKTLTFNLPQFKRRTSDLPLYTVTQTGTGAVKIVTDPGLALITHSFANTGGMKPPQLRDLAARAPYFHNGAAETLDDLVDFYDQNFSIGLTRREHRALVAFLNAI